MRKKTLAFPAVTGCNDRTVESIEGPAKSLVKNGSRLEQTSTAPTESESESLDSGKYGRHNLARFWKETANKLDSFRARVQEGKDLEAAREFCAYVIWSGMLRMFDAYPQEFPLKVDGAFLRFKAEDLQREIQERWRSGKNAPSIQFSEVQSINHKLDLIAGHLAKFSPPDNPVETAPAGLGW